jgi:hypothetical protein
MRKKTGLAIGSLSMEGKHKWKPLWQEEYSESYSQASPMAD